MKDTFKTIEKATTETRRERGEHGEEKQRHEPKGEIGFSPSIPPIFATPP
jgi:hypothetical protein